MLTDTRWSQQKSSMDLASSYNFNPYHMNGMGGMGVNMGFMMNAHAQYSPKDLQSSMSGLGAPPRGIVDYYHSCKSKFSTRAFSRPCPRDSYFFLFSFPDLKNIIAPKLFVKFRWFKTVSRILVADCVTTIYSVLSYAILWPPHTVRFFYYVKWKLTAMQSRPKQSFRRFSHYMYISPSQQIILRSVQFN